MTLAVAGAEDYVWTGGTGLQGWTTAAHWNPTGVPDSVGEHAILDSSTTRNCNLTFAVEPTSVTLAVNYPGTLTLSGGGAVVCDDFSLTSGTVISGPDKVIVARELRIEGGTIADVTAMESATVTGGTVGVLRLRGETTLRATSIDLSTSGTILDQIQSYQPVSVGTLAVASGRARQSQIFSPGVFHVDASATHTVASLSGLSVKAHTIDGVLELEPGSGAIFSLGAGISGKVDASSPGSAILCIGDWQISGQFLNAGNATNLLLVNQGTGGFIDHGANDADLVAVRGVAGQETEWHSSNRVNSLSVLENTTLRLLGDQKLEVGTIVNLGRMIEDPGAAFIHPATLRFVRETSGTAMLEFAPGEPIHVQLLDSDENLDGTQLDQVPGITVNNPRNGDTIVLSAGESGAATGIFQTDPIPTEQADVSIEDAILQALPGDVIEVSYIDDEDSFDNLAFDTITAVGEAAFGSSYWAMY